jgi:two-component system chemotaxis sensor kinase CheA
MTDELLRQLRETFIEELGQRVEELNRHLLELEKADSAEAKHDHIGHLFRAFHSLKGAARSVNYPEIESFCHALENMLGPVRDEGASLSDDDVQLMFDAADAIADAGKRLQQNEPLESGPLARMLRTMQSSARPTAQQPSSPSRQAKAPKPSPPPVADADAPRLQVPVERLDRLLAHSNQLVTATGQLQDRQSELQELHHELQRWETLMVREQHRQQVRGETAEAAVLPQWADDLRHELPRSRMRLEQLLSTLQQDSRTTQRAAEDVSEAVLQTRLMPFADACGGLERLARDVARDLGKDVRLQVEGGTAELDRPVILSLRDALRHLVRNAVDHGIELPDERRRVGKPEQGTVTVRAETTGTRAIIVVEDDGAGLQLERIATDAERRGLKPVDEDSTALIFHAGVSTSPMITSISGRGIGLDVVRSTVEALHGSVSVETTAGKGTVFRLEVSGRLTTLRAVVVSVNGWPMAVPTQQLVHLDLAAPDEFRQVEGADVFVGRDRPIPAAPLSAFFDQAAQRPAMEARKIWVLILRAPAGEAALVVDEVLGERDVLIEPLGPRLQNLPLASGATLLPDRRVAVILNTAALIRRMLGRRETGLVARLQRPEQDVPHRLLLVEDSITTRAIERNILEAAGYRVLTAADGLEAWGILQQEDVDLVVADVEMPRMDGVALTERVRAGADTRSLPVVLVTARESDRDKERGLRAGADAYIRKSTFDQRDLLEVIKQLL